MDAVGLGQTLGSVLPNGVKLSVKALKKWMNSEAAFNMYKESPEYSLLKSHGVRRAGATPFLFLKNPDGVCSPYAEQVNCWSGGTPKPLDLYNQSSDLFDWWATLLDGYFNLSKKADPKMDIIHIWNEPDAVIDKIQSISCLCDNVSFFLCIVLLEGWAEWITLCKVLHRCCHPSENAPS